MNRLFTTPLDPETAVVVVDMQVDFGLPAGSLYVTGAEEILAPVNALIDQARAAGAFVVYTQDYHPPVTPHFVTHGGLWPPHGVQGTPGADLLPGLHVHGPIMDKGTDGRDGYSGFSVRDPESGKAEATRLGTLLREHGIKRLIVVGLAGDYCVGETAIDGVREGFDVELPLPLTRFVNLSPGDDAAMVSRCETAGVAVTRQPAAAR
jgi:nicotinamidase/pyrazinamidase